MARGVAIQLVPGPEGREENDQESIKPLPLLSPASLTRELSLGTH